MIKLYNFDELRPEEILNRDIRAEKNVEDVVDGIIAEVRARGDEALKEYALKFDGAKIDDLQVTQAEIDEAFANMDPYFLETLREAAANIESFHRQQVHKNFVINEKPGIVLGQKYTPIEKAGVYVPGGTAAYPSTVLMDVIPAKVAGVSEIVMTTPAGKDGRVNPVILAAAATAGVTKIFKTGGAQEATSFARTFVMTEDGTSYFTLRQGAHGEGAVAPRTFAMLNDVPLFLSAQGVMGVYGTAVAEQNTIRSISESVRPRLVQEKAMENACAVVFEGRYYLALGGNVYIADGHLNEEDGYPAWFFWTNVPAQCLAVLGGRMWFGTNDGRLCRFSLPGDADAYTDDGEAIDAYWCTPTLSLSDWTRYKTIRDIIPTLMPYTRSSAALCFTDEGGETFRISRNLDLFAFRGWDFARLSFRCMPGAVSWRSRRHRHHRPLFTLRIGNDRAGEPFGLLALTLRWTENGSI